tara:strand:- start:11683 stop:12024 length:342 start_codon:yes stop_codon:yes gene_type:complete
VADDELCCGKSCARRLSVVAGTTLKRRGTKLRSGRVDARRGVVEASSFTKIERTFPRFLDPDYLPVCIRVLSWRNGNWLAKKKTFQTKNYGKSRVPIPPSLPIPLFVRCFESG